jgi:hypothetical protein
MVQRHVNKQPIRFEFQHDEEQAARIWDLSNLCLGVGMDKPFNFPMSDYEGGGQWAEEATEALRVDIQEFARIWSVRTKQSVLDGVLISLACVHGIRRHCHGANASAVACEQATSCIIKIDVHVRGRWQLRNVCVQCQGCITVLYVLTQSAAACAEFPRDGKGVPLQPQHVIDGKSDGTNGPRWHVQ